MQWTLAWIDLGKAMRARAVRDLSQLSDSALFAEVAEGLGLIMNNARRLYASATVLAEAKHFH